MDRGASFSPEQAPAAPGDLEGSATHVAVHAWVMGLLTMLLEVKNVSARPEDNEQFLCPGMTLGYRRTVVADCRCPIVR